MTEISNINLSPNKRRYTGHSYGCQIGDRVIKISCFAWINLFLPQRFTNSISSFQFNECLREVSKENSVNYPLTSPSVPPPYSAPSLNISSAALPVALFPSPVDHTDLLLLTPLFPFIALSQPLNPVDTPCQSQGCSSKGNKKAEDSSTPILWLLQFQDP